MLNAGQRALRQICEGDRQLTGLRVGGDRPGELHVGGEAVGDEEDPVAVAGQRLTEVDEAGSGPGSAELSISRLPTLANSGQSAASRVPKLACASVQATLPSAAFGLIEKPGGRVTVAAAQLARRGDRRAQRLGNGEFDVDARGGVGLVGGRLRVEARVEAELAAAGPLRPGRLGVVDAAVVGEDVQRGSSGASQVVGFCRNGVSGLFEAAGGIFGMHGLPTVFGSLVLAAPLASQSVAA